FWHDRGPVHTEMGTTRSRSGNELRGERSDRASGRPRAGAHRDGGSSGESPSWSARKRSKCSPISSAVGRSIRSEERRGGEGGEEFRLVLFDSMLVRPGTGPLVDGHDPIPKR